MSDLDTTQYVTLTADITSAFVANNHVSPVDIPGLMTSIHNTIKSLSENGGVIEPAIVMETVKADSQPVKLEAKVPISKSITNEYLVCLIDGLKLKSLKRHIGKLGYTPESYREAFSLPDDYPMVAPAYSAKRSELARSLGLGKKAVSQPSEETASAS